MSNESLSIRIVPAFNFTPERERQLDRFVFDVLDTFTVGELGDNTYGNDDSLDEVRNAIWADVRNMATAFRMDEMVVRACINGNYFWIAANVWPGEPEYDSPYSICGRLNQIDGLMDLFDTFSKEDGV